MRDIQARLHHGNGGGPTGDATPTLRRADLHAHTRASARGATRWLDALNVPECRSTPEEVFDAAIARGMDFVAITDHDVIDGAMELLDRGFQRIIVGEEITTRLPGSGCALHVLAWRLTPELHEEIEQLNLRADAIALARWLRAHRLPHALAHPLFDLDGRLTLEALEQSALLFGGFELINAGHTTSRHRAALQRFLASLTPRTLARLSRTHNIEPVWPIDGRWLTAGGDDHALLNIARAWTGAAIDSHDADAFFDALMAGDAVVGGQDATCDTLAHQFTAVAARHLHEHKTPANDPLADPALERLRADEPLRAALRPFLCMPKETCPDHESLRRHLDRHARRGVARLARALDRARSAGPGRLDVAGVIDAALPQLVIEAPAVAAIRQHHRERRLLAQLTAPRISQKRDPLRICLVVDALEHTSGVSRFVRDAAKRAQDTHRDLTIISAGDPSRFEALPNVRMIQPDASFALPGYEGLSLPIAPLANVVRACAETQPDVIHVSTPGPMGLCGAVAAWALNVPLAGMHHTDLPAYAEQLLGSPAVGWIASRLLGALYNRFDLALARSRAYAMRIESLGVSAGRIAVMAPGIDLSRFDPTRRDLSVWDRHPPANRSTVKALYVGRLSAEKNTPMLSRVWREAHTRLSRLGVNAELIVVGDGPRAGAMRNELAGAAARFLGELRGDELADLYASCDLFLFPSTTDTLGQVVIEAQASGLPALVSDIGGPRELIDDGATGAVLPAADERAWVRAIVELCADPDRRRAMGHAARAHALRFSFERSFEHFWRLHQRLVEQRVPPARSRSAAPDIVIHPDRDSIGAL